MEKDKKCIDIPGNVGCVVKYSFDNTAEEISCSAFEISPNYVIAPACLLGSSILLPGSKPSGKFVIAKMCESQRSLITYPGHPVMTWFIESVYQALSYLSAESGIQLFDPENTLIDSKLLSQFILLHYTGEKRSLQSMVSYYKKCLLLNPYDKVFLCSTPFGMNYADIFMNSITSGIVSRVLNTENSLYLSDIRACPGSEGGLIYKYESSSSILLPCGVLLHPLVWRNTEPSNLALVISLDTVLRSLSYHQGITRNNLKFNISRYISNIEYDVDRSASNQIKSLVIVDCKSSWGTGVLLSERHVLTCAHVVKMSKNGKITLYHNQVHCSGDIMYMSKNPQNFDVAVVKLHQALSCPPLRLSESFQLGQEITACGFGMLKDSSKPICTSGVISKILSTSSVKYSILTSCSVHPGSSGGLFLNEKGEAVGMITSYVFDSTNSSDYTSLSFGVPMATIKPGLDDVINLNSVKLLTELENLFPTSGQFQSRL